MPITTIDSMRVSSTYLQSLIIPYSLLRILLHAMIPWGTLPKQIHLLALLWRNDQTRNTYNSSQEVKQTMMVMILSVRI